MFLKILNPVIVVKKTTVKAVKNSPVVFVCNDVLEEVQNRPPKCS